MIQRRDLVLGVLLLAFVSILIVGSLLILISVTMGGIPVSEKSVAIIEITGPILSPTHTVEKLERYMKNENILAIVLRLNTPGGGVAASQEIYETVKKARRAGKKVYASMGSVAASGGYYIAAACDTIMANQGTITGSIGVIINFADFSGLYEKLGIDFYSRKSGKFKDTGSSSREMTDEEKALIDEMVMDTYEQFIQAVSEGRDLDIEYVRGISDGRVFTGRQAMNNGLVDVLGTYQDAIDLAGVSVGLGEDPPVVRESRGLFRELLIDEVRTLFSNRLDLSFPSISYILSL